jgi:hypothetical protein
MSSSRSRRGPAAGLLVLGIGLFLGASFAWSWSSIAAAGEAEDQLASDGLLHAPHNQGGGRAPHGHRGRRRWRHGDQPRPFENQGIADIDSLANFNVPFNGDGFASNGSPQTSWIVNIVGGSPERGGETVIEAPIVPVSVDLLDFDGSLRVFNGTALHYDVTPFVEPTLRSPLFQNARYSSSRRPTQFIDAIQRAQFFNRAPSDWHTRLAPVLRTARTMAIPFGSYRFALDTDGTCCAFVTVDSQVFDGLLFPPDPSDVTTPVGAAENAGDITAQDLATFLFPNTFFYVGAQANCCILGFHTYDFEPGDAENGNRERRFVIAVATWISPGRLAGVEDVSALSHELLEATNDPFVGTDGEHNLTPWWQDPSGSCQNKNEIGDVVQGLPGAVFPIAMPEMTYHLQNMALLPWFRPGQGSDAIDGAFSYPDETLLTTPTPLWRPHCQ